MRPAPHDVSQELTEPLPRGGSAAPLERRRRADLDRALTVAKWTDSRFLDPVLELVLPGVGDVLGAAAGLYIVGIAVRHGAPRTVVARMLVNLSVDCLGGVLPIVGDLFDALNRANLRNVRLLERHLAQAAATSTVPSRTRLGVLAAPIALLAAAFTVALGAAYFLATRL